MLPKSTSPFWVILSLSLVFSETTAESALSSLLSKSTPVRGLQSSYSTSTNSSYVYDLTSFSVRYDKCQYVKAYDDKLAADESTSDPLATKHFVLFRLCPSDTCSSCDQNYGKYVTEIDTYLKYTVQQQREIFYDMCQSCGEKCGGEYGNCTTQCGQECYFYSNLESMGYADATNYMQCQKFSKSSDRRQLELLSSENQRFLDESETEEESVYIGPRCFEGGIKIGLFTDADCWEPLGYSDVPALLGKDLSYYFMDHTYTSNTDKHKSVLCLPCKEDESNDNQDINQMCDKLYYAAAKCETPTGISGGFIQYQRNAYGQSNQAENEYMACTFIDSLLWNSYTERGEIDYVSRQDVFERHITKLQAISLSLIMAFYVVLIGLIYYFHKRIEALQGNSILEPADPHATWA